MSHKEEIPEVQNTQVSIRKQQSHGRIGEAATVAKCWMHGIPAYSTQGLRANFAGSDILVDTIDPTKKLLIQVKTGYMPAKGGVYMTQGKDDSDRTNNKFVADFVVFVNLDKKAGEKHQHDGTLNFEHLRFYVVPRDEANRVFRESVNREYNRLKKNGERRKIGNLAVYADPGALEPYRDKWNLIFKNPSTSVAPLPATSSPPNT